MAKRLRPGYVQGPNGERAILTKSHTRGEWTLRHGGRVRWGRGEEISSDIEFFERCGKLPERQVGWF